MFKRRFKRRDEYEGWFIQGCSYDGKIFREVPSREEGIKWLREWLGRELDKEYIMGDVVVNDGIGYAKLVYIVYRKCFFCDAPISDSDYHKNYGTCDYCYVEEDE